MTTEPKLTKKVKKFCKFHGIWWWKISDRYRRGMPDFLFLIDGNALFLEVKTTGKKATPMQKLEGKKIHSAGAYWACVDNEEDLDDYLAMLERERWNDDA